MSNQPSDRRELVIVCGLGHLSEVELEEGTPSLDLVVFAVKFDRKGPKKEEGRKEGRDKRTCPLGMQRGGLFFHLS